MVREEWWQAALHRQSPPHVCANVKNQYMLANGKLRQHLESNDFSSDAIIKELCAEEKLHAGESSCHHTLAMRKTSLHAGGTKQFENRSGNRIKDHATSFLLDCARMLLETCFRAVVSLGQS